jgi:hypothetical protein
VTGPPARVLKALPRRKFGMDVVLVMVVGVSACLPFMLAPFRAIILGPGVRGEFAFFQSAVSIIGLTCTLGLRLACYQLGLFGVNRYSIRYQSLAVASILCGAVVAIPAAIVAFNSVSSLVGYFILASLVLCIGYAFNQVETANSQNLQLRRRIAATTASPALVEFLVNMLLMLVQRLNLIVSMAITILAEAIRGALAVVWNRHDRRNVELPPSHFSNNALYRASLISAPAAVVPLLSGNLDVLMYGALVETAALGHYVVAKLGFSAMLVAGTVLEGRAITLVGRLGLFRTIAIVVGIGGGLALAGGAAGWVLTPVVFGREFIESANAFPAAAAAGFFAFLFVSLTAINSHLGAQSRLGRVMPGLFVLLGIVMSSLAIPAAFGSDAVAMTLGLMGSQLLGVISIVAFSLRNWRKSHA